MKDALALAPFVVFLAVLPYPGTVALRLLALAGAFVMAVSIRGRGNPVSWPVRWAFLPWILVCIASLGYAVDFDYSLGEIKNELGYAMMAFFAFLSVSSGSSRAVVLVCIPVLSLGILSAWALGATFLDGRWPQGGGHGGTGTFATHLLVLIPCMLCAFALSGDRRLRGALAVCAALCLVAALFSQQRIIWVVFAVQAAAIIGLLSAGRRGGSVDAKRILWMILMVLAVLALGGAVVLLAHVAKYGAQAFGAFAVDADPRVRQWPLVAHRILEHWDTGAGFGRNAMKLAHPDLIPADAPLFWHAHNMLLNYGLALGLPGIAALLLLLGALAITFSRLALLGSGPARFLGAAGAALVIGLITRNLTNDFFVRDGALMFWALAGLIYGRASREACRT